MIMSRFIEVGPTPSVWPVPASSVTDLGYAVTTATTSPWLVVPDGRCGLAVVDDEVWWMGPLSRPWRPDRSGVRVLGVRLALSAGRAVAGQSLAGWRDARAPLRELWGQQASTELSTHLALAGSTHKKVAVLAREAQRRASSASGGSDVARLAQLVVTGRPVADIAATLSITPRQVHRRCTDLFGLPPSTMRRIARLHATARTRTTAGRVTLADLASASGYADQSHMTREVRALTGQPPRPAFS